jgi:hypothetical protein
MPDPLTHSSAPHIAEWIARAQDMLGRLGPRRAYEPNYTGEKLADVARCCIEALALLDEPRDDIETLSSRAWEHGHQHRESLRRNLRAREEAADGLRCVRCLEREGAMRPAGTLAGQPHRQVFEHAKCADDRLAPEIEIDATEATG